MKKLWLILALFLGFNLINVQAQDEVEESETTVQVEENDVDVEDEPQVAHTKGEKDRSKAGDVLHETGSAIGSGAKWTGEKIGDGASWTWKKLKHNKLTKEMFNQPGDRDDDDDLNADVD